MPNKLHYICEVKEGQLLVPETMQQEIEENFNNKKIVISVAKQSNKRSNKANSYYWAVVIPSVIRGMIDLGNELTYGSRETHQMVHEYLKDKFLDNGEAINFTGERQDKFKPTTKKCTNSEFSLYVDMIKKWSLEYLGIVIPEPSEVVADFKT